MTSLDWTILLTAAAAGIVLMALFAGMETGLYTLNRVRLELRAGEHDRRAEILASLLARPQRMLAVVLIGTNAANQLAAWSIAALLHGAGVGPLASIIVDTAILVPVLLVFAEVLPKDLFRAHGDNWCYRLARPLQAVNVALQWTLIGPLTEWFGRGVSALVGGDAERDVTARQRMSDLLKEGMGAGVLTASQTNLLDRAMQLREHVVADLMIPWHAVQTVAAHAGPAQRRAAIDSRRSRLPVLASSGQVVGVVSILDLDADPGESLASQAQDAMTLSPEARADTSLRALRAHHATIAIVKDHQGHAIGIVTVKDLIAPLLAAPTTTP
jgi:CBS domain containing-hemolysin-like protein